MKKQNKKAKKPINFLDLAVTDFSHLRITGVLNYDLYKDMKDEDLLAFVCKDVTEKCCKFVSDEWQEEVNVVADYTVIDSYYNKRGNLTAKLVYKHFDGTTGFIRRRGV